MATLYYIAFFLACALFLQDIQAQSNFEYNEESSSSSSSSEKTESYKKEVKLVKDKTSYVMGLACHALSAIDVDCVVGAVGRRFMDNIIIDIDFNFKFPKIRILYVVAYLSEKMVKCISKMTSYVTATITNSLPSCMQNAMQVLNKFCKSNLEVITEILRTIYDFPKNVASCTLTLGACIKNVFDIIYGSVMKIIESITANSQQVVGSIHRLTNPGCSQGISTEVPNPTTLVLQCGSCVFCTLRPTAQMCRQ